MTSVIFGSKVHVSVSTSTVDIWHHCFLSASGLLEYSGVVSCCTSLVTVVQLLMI